MLCFQNVSKCFSNVFGISEFGNFFGRALDYNTSTSYYTQTKEGQDSVYGGVWEAKDGGEADGDGEAEEDAEDAGQGEEQSEVQHGEPPQHEDRVEEHRTVPHQHQVGVEEYCFGTITMLFSSV